MSMIKATIISLNLIISLHRICTSDLMASKLVKVTTNRFISSSLTTIMIETNRLRSFSLTTRRTPSLSDSSSSTNFLINSSIFYWPLLLVFWPKPLFWDRTLNGSAKKSVYLPVVISFSLPTSWKVAKCWFWYIKIYQHWLNQHA